MAAVDKKPRSSNLHRRQQRFGGDFKEFQETFKLSGTRPREDVERDLKVFDKVLAEQRSRREKK